MFNYFSKYGQINQFSINFDKKTRASRGFGFVIFDKEKSVENVLKNKNSHCIRGKWIDCKPSYSNNNEDDSYSNEELENETSN